LRKLRINHSLILANISEPEPTKGSKRLREESEEAPQLVDTSKVDTTGLSKSQKKKQKKQKLESGETAPVNGSSLGEKKVQFASKLEQGPTKGETTTTAPAKPAISPTQPGKPEKKTVTLANGVVIEDHKIGTGPRAKKGAKLGIRYIGKLSKNGKEFDKNTKGKPFRFTLGKGEVIKGTNCPPFLRDRC
jgi:FK506-binding nuclear protein